MIEEVRMSYRNDHDAALARIDDLEAELERLNTPEPPKPPRAPKLPAILALLSIVVASTAGAVVALEHDARVRAEPVATAPIAPDPMACRQAISRVYGFDARSTDPHAATPRDVSQIVASGAPCREQLPEGRWRAAEDELAGAISRIVVYYRNDPYALDNYVTAPQLWKEYNAAIAARDHVLLFAPPSS